MVWDQRDHCEHGRSCLTEDNVISALGLIVDSGLTCDTATDSSTMRTDVPRQKSYMLYNWTLQIALK
jgi:hypothetical protein